MTRMGAYNFLQCAHSRHWRNSRLNSSVWSGKYVVTLSQEGIRTCYSRNNLINELLTQDSRTRVMVPVTRGLSGTIEGLGT